MPFSKGALLTVIALAASVFESQTFAPSACIRHRTAVRADQPMYVAISSPIDDLIGATDDDEEDDDIDLRLMDDDEEEPEFIVSDGDIEGEVDAEADENTEEKLPGWYTLSLRLKEVREQYRRHDTDTGSPEFQIAGMTERITYLTKHLKVHPKDFSTRRGLVALVNKRRRLLNYLFKEDTNRYKALVDSLGVRHKPPSPVQSREEKYGRFPPQKEPKNRKKLRKDKDYKKRKN